MPYTKQVGNVANRAGIPSACVVERIQMWGQTDTVCEQMVGGAATGGKGEASEKHEVKNTQSDGQGVTRCA